MYAVRQPLHTSTLEDVMGIPAMRTPQATAVLQLWRPTPTRQSWVLSGRLASQTLVLGDVAPKVHGITCSEVSREATLRGRRVSDTRRVQGLPDRTELN